MPCEPFKDETTLGNRVTGFICGPRRARPSERCGETGCTGTATALCDWPTGPGRKTCDRKLCDRHGHRVGPNRDYCGEHFYESEERKAIEQEARA